VHAKCGDLCVKARTAVSVDKPVAMVCFATATTCRGLVHKLLRAALIIASLATSPGLWSVNACGVITDLLVCQRVSISLLCVLVSYVFSFRRVLRAAIARNLIIVLHLARGSPARWPELWQSLQKRATVDPCLSQTLQD